MAGLREALESALDAAPDAELNAGAAANTDAAPVETPGTSADATPPAPAADTTPAADDTRPRDAFGRFLSGEDKTPKEGAAAAPVGATPATTAVTPTGAAVPPADAPASWKADVKAEWSKLPPAVQAEVIRRENDVQRVLHDNSQLRPIVDTFRQIARNNQDIVQANNGDFVGMVNNFMQAERVMRLGTPAEKARVFAQYVQNYAVDISLLDQALAGIDVPDNPNDMMARTVQQAVQQAMAPVNQLMTRAQQRQQERAQQEEQNIITEQTTFAQTHPHFETVRTMMADIMEVCERNHEEISLQEAYDRALVLHPQLRGSTLAQQTAQTAAQLNTAALKARNASASLRVPAASSPSTGDTSTKPRSLRDTIEAAMHDVPLQ